MALHVTIDVTLILDGPIICAETGPMTWGVDKTFSRDYLGRYCIDRSHIKGKLREALSELGINETIVGKLLGMENDSPGRLDISHFYPADEKSQKGYRTRIQINDKTKTVDPRMLMIVEDNFPTGKSYVWRGSVNYDCETESEALKTASDLEVGFKWISALGALKGIGFGAVRSVELSNRKIVENKPVIEINQSGQSQDELGLRITLLEAFLSLGPRKKTNYNESESIIKGNVIKAALCQALNRRLNPSGHMAEQITVDNKHVKEKFPLLCESFDKITITHAFPTTKDGTRPVVIPYSSVVVSKEDDSPCHYDLALTTDTIDLLIDGEAPRFETDWKDNEFPMDFGWARPRRIHKTRTAINPKSRTAEENKLFTFQYVCPVDAQAKDIFWLARLRFDSIPEGKRPGVIAELCSAVRWIDRMGKRQGHVKVDISQKPWRRNIECQPIDDKTEEIIITLQSDALILDPHMVRNGDGDLFDYYCKYWDDISESSLELTRFFAKQKLVGRYLPQGRFPSLDGAYYPYYLTTAGSVFVLRHLVNNDPSDYKKVSEWVSRGLALPRWAQEQFGKDNKEPSWETCPFVRENGFGEIIVNSRWHWDRKVDGSVCNERQPR